MTISDKIKATLGHDSGTIFVVSYSDVVGCRVAKQLLKAGHSKVRVGVEKSVDAADIKDLVLQGAAVMNFEWELEQTYAKVLNGVHTVFCDIPYHEDWSAHFPAFMEACRTAGVKHLIKLSFFNALVKTHVHLMKNFHVSVPEENEYTQVPLLKMHGTCDEMLVKSRALDYTILFASHLMSTPLVTQKTHLQNSKLYGAHGGKQVSYVSPNDVAEAAVRVLLNPEAHARMGYNLCGPVMTDEEVATALGEAFGRNIQFQSVPLDEFAKEEGETEHEPNFMVDDLVSFEYMKSTGVEAGFKSNDLQKVCGHPAESFADYLANKSLMTNFEMAN